MQVQDFIFYTVIVIIVAFLSIPFSAMISKNKPILAFLLPVILLLIGLGSFIIFWNFIHPYQLIYYFLGYYAILGSGSTLLGSLYIIFIRNKNR